MRIEFDPAKDAINRAKHGLPLALGAKVIEGAVERVEDTRFDYGEDRYIAFGYVGERLHVCVFVVREDVTRVISVRKASTRERIIHG